MAPKPEDGRMAVLAMVRDRRIDRVDWLDHMFNIALIGAIFAARVAYRMALDHPERVIAPGVLDIIPTLDVSGR